MGPPILQVALDLVETDRAVQIADEAVAGGADWLEAGTPLIKSEGLQAVRALREHMTRRLEEAKKQAEQLQKRISQMSA